ncbi:type IV pilus modification PilV family protein [Allorhodopirellula solitaria]|uniref:Bacterial type II secretion system protein I/J n=1 Tax=Allorhodopirellula solitaria TaxID=2527987 RepID=A0A5C5XNR3_9BACT|nr:acyltransferase [Allorhodopirellula solitaria]TWT64817.1 hypothetical protein CA85_36020 [Allorhodopirellula solitaria]
MKNRKSHRQRTGFTLIETLIATAFLAAAMGMTLKMHQSRLDFERISLQRLTDQLAIENIAERLVAVDDESLSDTAAELADQAGGQVNVDPFESGSTRGQHLTITIDSAGGPLVHHVWRLEPES